MSETDHGRKNIAVIFGGCSPEYEISLQSASAIVENLDREKYEPILVGISKEGKWFLYRGSVENIRQDKWLTSVSDTDAAAGENTGICLPAIIPPDRGDRRLLVFDSSSGTVTERIYLDAALPVLHGKNGEDGSVQGLLALADIPVAGCGITSSALCMDKNLAHQLAASCGIQVPRSLMLKGPLEDHIDRLTVFVIETGLPVFVKPVKAGSSLGITKVTSTGDLPSAIETAFIYDDEVIIEECIDGFEVGCAIVGEHHLTVGEPDEICLDCHPQATGNFFDYVEKYTLDHSTIYVPARVSVEMSRKIRWTAVNIYRALGCSGFARVDMFLTPSGKLVFNEVNTIPGFTQHSRFPAMMKAAGIDFGPLLDMILSQALEKDSMAGHLDGSFTLQEVM